MRIKKTQGDNQKLIVGAEAELLVLEVNDDRGRPISQLQTEWQVAEGNVQIDVALDDTDQTGQTLAAITIQGAGPYRVTCAVGKKGSKKVSVEFKGVIEEAATEPATEMSQNETTAETPEQPENEDPEAEEPAETSSEDVAEPVNDLPPTEDVPEQPAAQIDDAVAPTADEPAPIADDAEPEEDLPDATADAEVIEESPVETVSSPTEPLATQPDEPATKEETKPVAIEPPAEVIPAAIVTPPLRNSVTPQPSPITQTETPTVQPTAHKPEAEPLLPEVPEMVAEPPPAETIDEVTSEPEDNPSDRINEEEDREMLRSIAAEEWKGRGMLVLTASLTLFGLIILIAIGIMAAQRFTTSTATDSPQGAIQNTNSNAYACPEVALSADGKRLVFTCAPK